MNFEVLGATGRTGRLVVEQAIAAGHTVTALVRSPEKLTTSSVQPLPTSAGAAASRMSARRSSTENRPCLFGFEPTPTYRRAALVSGNRINGPALIEEHASTTVLMPGDACEVDAYGNLVIAVGGAR